MVGNNLKKYIYHSKEGSKFNMAFVLWKLSLNTDEKIYNIKCNPKNLIRQNMKYSNKKTKYKMDVLLVQNSYLAVNFS